MLLFLLGENTQLLWEVDEIDSNRQRTAYGFRHDSFPLFAPRLLGHTNDSQNLPPNAKTKTVESPQDNAITAGPVLSVACMGNIIH